MPVPVPRQNPTDPSKGRPVIDKTQDPLDPIATAYRVADAFAQWLASPDEAPDMDLLDALHDLCDSLPGWPDGDGSRPSPASPSEEELDRLAEMAVEDGDALDLLSKAIPKAPASPAPQGAGDWDEVESALSDFYNHDARTAKPAIDALKRLRAPAPGADTREAAPDLRCLVLDPSCLAKSYKGDPIRCQLQAGHGPWHENFDQPIMYKWQTVPAALSQPKPGEKDQDGSGKPVAGAGAPSEGK